MSSHYADAEQNPGCKLSKSASSPLLSSPLLSSPLYHYNSVTSAACPFFHDCLCILCTPSPLFHTNMSHSPPPLSPLSSKPHPLPPPTWPSAVQLDSPVAGCMDAQWLPSTNCSLTLLPLCLFSCSLSLLLSPSLSLSFSLSICSAFISTPPSSSAFIQIIYPSPSDSLCYFFLLPLFLAAAAALAASPYIPPFLPTLPPSSSFSSSSSSSSFWRSSKLTSTHSHIA